MKTLVFAVAGYNLAETGRMTEIAREARNHFDVIFASYGGKFEELIGKEGFSLTKLEPRLTREQLDRLRIVLSGETLNTVGYRSTTRPDSSRGPTGATLPFSGGCSGMTRRG